MISFKKYFIPSILVLPMVLHWLLPWGTELKLYISFLGIDWYTPDFLYLIYIISYFKKKNHPYILSSSRRVVLTILGGVYIMYGILSVVTKEVDYVPDLLVNNFSFVWLSLLFLLCPLTYRQLQRTKPIMVTSLIILVSEVLLYGLGILHYTTAAGNTLQGQDYDGVMRISTTIGAATGTALIIGLLGAVVINIYPFTKKARIALILLTTIGVYFTMSRGTSLAWTIYVAYDVYHNYLKGRSLNLKIKAIIAAFLVVAGVYFGGGFNPLLNRVNKMEQSGDVTAGRDGKFRSSINDINEHAPFGYGLAQCLPEKAVEMKYRGAHHSAPHNVYILIGLELGYIGIALYLTFVLFIVTGISYKCSLSFYILLVFLINSNTESLVLDSEAMALLMFAVMTVTKYYTAGHRLRTILSLKI